MFEKYELEPIKSRWFKPVVSFLLFLDSLLIYTVIFGIRGALLIILLILLHEGGHIWVIIKGGIKLKSFYFIPLFGAAVEPEKEMASREGECLMAIMGPTLDLIWPLILIIGYWQSKDILFLALMVLLALNDLLNLLPVIPFDGGLVLQSISFSLPKRIKLTLVGLGYFLSAVIFLFVIVIPTGISLFVIFVEGFSEKGLDVSRLSLFFSLSAFLIFASLQLLWTMFQIKNYAEEEVKKKKAITRFRLVATTAIYLSLISLYCFIFIFGVALMIDNPETQPILAIFEATYLP